jgi:hypothetical protein
MRAVREGSEDDGKQCRLTFGDNILTARAGRPYAEGRSRRHTLANRDTDKSVKPAVEAELRVAACRYERLKTASMSRTRRLRSADGREKQ